MKTKTNKTGLAIVQQLYFLQTELIQFVENADEVQPDDVKKAKSSIKEFKSLLKEADWKYMGGEDVYNSLEKFMIDINKEIKDLTKKTLKRPAKQTKQLAA